MSMKRYLPLRDYIFDRLYHSTDGYFCRNNIQLGQMSSPINFKSLIGYDDYQRELYQRYPRKAWLTPSQIFKPYYGMAIANYILQAHQKIFGKNSYREKIRIVEAGAGTGSAADSILYYFQNYQPKILPNVQYHIVEISSVLCQKIQRKLTESHPKIMHNKQIKIFNQNILNYKTDEHVYTLFLEVLDNLPHDRLIMNLNTKKYQSYTTVQLDTQIQSTAPIQTDPLIQQCLTIYQKTNFKSQPIHNGILDRIAELIVEKIYKGRSKGKQQYLYLPTYLLKLMKKWKVDVPKAHFLISDFNNLISTIPGINAPIVSTKGDKSQQKIDHKTYLVNRGEADIFFPINFQLLQSIYSQTFNQQSQLVKSYQFINEFSIENWAVSKSGFNPVKQDFSNTSFFLTKIK